jgi:hypothetical protein
MRFGHRPLENQCLPENGAAVILCEGTVFDPAPCTLRCDGRRAVKAVSAAILSMLMFIMPAFAQAAASGGPLAPGKPAGVRNAQFEDGNGMFVVAGAALIGITVALATAGSGASANGTGSGSTSTSTSTSTTGTSP